MQHFCKDRDLLICESTIFLNSKFPINQISSGSAGQIANNIFSASADNFNTQNISAGMVLVIYNSIPSEGQVYEIITINSSSTITVSPVRTSDSDQATPISNLQNYKFKVISYLPIIQKTADEILAKIGSDFPEDNFEISQALKSANTAGALADIFRARSNSADKTNSNWQKAEYYESQFKTRLRNLQTHPEIQTSQNCANVKLRRM